MSRIASPKPAESSPISQRKESFLSWLTPSCMVTLTGPGTSADLIRSPSALEMPTVGIVIVGSSPAMPKAPRPRVLAMIDADRAGVLRVLGLDDEGAAAAVEQRDVAGDGGRVVERGAAVGGRAGRGRVAGSAGSATSVPTTTLPVTPAAVTGGPKARRPRSRSWRCSPGELITTCGLAVVWVRADADLARLRVDVALAAVLAAVDEVDGLAPDVGVGLVHRARLPLVDQPGRALGVGVAPLVGHDVVGGHAVAVVGGDAVPVGVGAGDARVVVDR